MITEQAQGAAKPLHIWPGDSAQELAADFDALLDRIMRTGRIPVPGEARALSALRWELRLAR